LAPDVALPYVYKAWCYIFYSGDTASAREVLETASGRADIASSRYYWWLARIVEPDFRKALDESRLGPDTTGYLLHRAQLYRLLDLPDQERIYADSARRLLEVKIRDYPDDPRFHSQLGLAYAGLRQKPEALAHGQKAVELLPASRDAFDALFLVINLAETMVIFGEYDAALDQLEYLMSIPGFVSVPYLQLDPVWKPLRALPRFQKMIGKT
jgi:tetratricopeptide (TPR) repeat protein